MNLQGPKSGEMARRSSPTGSSTCSPPSGAESVFSNDNASKCDKKKKKIIPKIFSSKKKPSMSDDEGYESELEKNLPAKVQAYTEEPSLIIRKSLSGGILATSSQVLAFLKEEEEEIHSLSLIFVKTWNVGGRTPTVNLNLEDLLQVEKPSDIYVIGFQEIVPLNAGNVLVIEDNEPAAKWIALINEALNRPDHENSVLPYTDTSQGSKPCKDTTKSKFFQKPSLKVLTRNLKVEGSPLKTCNCYLYSSSTDGWRARTNLDPYLPLDSNDQNGDDCMSITDIPSSAKPLSSTFQAKYRLVGFKQMVGIFLSVWARQQLTPHIAHLRICTMGRGIMGRLGNKGCISLSMTLHKTSLCFVCSHLASGEKEGDELRRNADVAEIMKSMQFPNMCKKSNRPAPEKIIDHDMVLWFGDLNYRVSSSYEETKALMEGKKWELLLRKDQLTIEREAGRVFSGWKEGEIHFAPTYKYCRDSDSYSGDTSKSKKKRRTPAWCDRILWHGEGIKQLSYSRGESRFSDHRPVCAVFRAETEVEVRGKGSRFRKGYSYMDRRQIYSVALPQKHKGGFVFKAFHLLLLHYSFPIGGILIGGILFHQAVNNAGVAVPAGSCRPQRLVSMEPWVPCVAIHLTSRLCLQIINERLLWGQHFHVVLMLGGARGRPTRLLLLSSSSVSSSSCVIFRHCWIFCESASSWFTTFDQMTESLAVILSWRHLDRRTSWPMLLGPALEDDMCLIIPASTLTFHAFFRSCGFLYGGEPFPADPNRSRPPLATTAAPVPGGVGTSSGEGRSAASAQKAETPGSWRSGSRDAAAAPGSATAYAASGSTAAASSASWRNSAMAAGEFWSNRTVFFHQWRRLSEEPVTGFPFSGTIPYTNPCALQTSISFTMYLRMASCDLSAVFLRDRCSLLLGRGGSTAAAPPSLSASRFCMRMRSFHMRFLRAS
ncbi:hypothetical protein V2J09_008921 [Rumex salicifolius]